MVPFYSENVSNTDYSEFLSTLCDETCENKNISLDLYNKYNVKRGLRNADGTGVLVGLTRVGEVRGYIIDENEKVPIDGRLLYRGIDVYDLCAGCRKDGRFGYEECIYLLLTGKLPNKSELDTFTQYLADNRSLPNGFAEDMILKAPSSNIMNKIARSVLAAYSYDENPDDLSISNVLRQSLLLIAQLPVMVSYAYQAKSHYYDGNSLYIHRPERNMSTAENILHMIRPDGKFTKLEAEILDLALILHAEHGGGNNSSFTIRVVSSSGTDTYAAVSSAIDSLKGPKHGGANLKVMDMIDDIKAHVDDCTDEDKMFDYLCKILRKEAYDHTGLVYGMGHAVYTMSDPRAVLLKEKATELATVMGKEDEFKLYQNIEKLTPKAFELIRGKSKVMCANVDLYSGFVYSMLNIPRDLYTPLFAVSRVAGWAAHRIEELIAGQKIIRPAYKNIGGRQSYADLDCR
ncbi:MAG: citrate/2-methylcitrate synthase [Ruminococcaceae bacterium]|nr:citrate/2-methylcitrate synthase [Oscillospiraceae bacterium]